MKYGFVLADIHRGTSNNVGPAVVSLFPEGGGDTLFIFPGGRLTGTNNPDYLRSSVFDYVNRGSLDAAVVWMSTLTGVLGQKEVEEKLVELENIPHVTIGSREDKPSRWPDIYFNAYSGMTSMVDHMVLHHKAKRIAYLRGPETHMSSEERFHAYLDALERHHLKVDHKLISSPHSWSEGGDAIRELLEKNQLVPGKDFDTLICASDLMLSGAMKVLEEDDSFDASTLRLCGFNDSLDAKMQSVPCTTVRFPYTAIAKKAVDTLHAMLKGEETEKSILLDMPPVIRKSCGCRGLHLEETAITEDLILSMLEEATGLSKERIHEEATAAFEKGDEKAIRRFLSLLLSTGGDLYAINEAVECFPVLSIMGPNKRERIYKSIRYLLPEEIERASLKRYSKEKKLSDSLNDFKLKLLRVNTVKEIQKVLSASVSSLAFTEAFLVLNRGDDLALIREEGDILFPKNQILPSSVIESLSHAAYVVEPLFSEDEVLGHLVLGIKTLNGAECEEVRGAVASAVRSSLLFEQTKSAKETAEKVEYDRTVFFSSVKEKLRQPIAEIGQLLERGSEIGEKERSSIQKSIASSRRIIDLALSRSNELDLDFQTVDMNRFLLPFLKDGLYTVLPTLFIDEEKLSLILSDISTEETTIEVRMDATGLRVVLSTASVDDADTDYYQNVLLMHGGTFSYEENGSAVLTLPYPTLSNKASLSRPQKGVVAAFGTLEGMEIPGLEKTLVDPSEFLSSKRLPQDTVAISWDPAFVGEEAYAALKLLEADEGYNRLSFLTYGLNGGMTLLDSIQEAMGPELHRILLAGNLLPEKYPWQSNAQMTAVDLKKAVRKCEEVKPSLVVVNHSEEEDVLSFLSEFRSNERTSVIPVLVVQKSVGERFVSAIQDYPKTLVATFSILSSEDFSKRMRSILAGEQILPVYSGAIVKKAQVYLSENYMNQISRWQVADSVHVSEDYLTSIFRKEIGISPWDYLNRVRIEEAAALLRDTGMSVLEVSKATGFQGQAYFCTVFKKLTGQSPSALRKKH